MSAQAKKTASMRRQVIAVLALAVLLAFALAGGIAWRHGAFLRTAELYLIADTAAGIGTGTAVRLSGFPIGTVSDMALQPDHKVRVTLRINEEQFAQLRADASAQWIKEQLQAATLDLNPGKADEPLSKTDPRIGYSRRGTLTEIAADLRGRLAPILDDVKELTGTVREQRAAIAAVLQNAAAASRELAETAKEVRALTADVRPRVAAIGAQTQATMAEARATAAAAKQSMERVGALVGQAEQSLGTVNAALPSLLQKTGDTLDHVNAIARDGRTVSAAAASGVPGMLASVPPLLDDSRDMVQGVRQSWLMRKLLPAPVPAALPLDSHDATALREPVAR